MNGHFSEEDILRGNKREKMPNILGSESGNESRAVMPDSLWPHGLYSHRILHDRILEWVDSSLFQGIFPTQGSNPGPLHCRQSLYQLGHQGHPPTPLGKWKSQPHWDTTLQPPGWLLSRKHNNMYWTRCKEIRALIYCGGEYEMEYFLWKTIWSF